MEKVKVFNHKKGEKKPEESSYKIIHENTDGNQAMSGVYLKLMKISHKNHHCVKEIKIAEKAKKIDIKFSKDCEHFAISYQTKKILTKKDLLDDNWTPDWTYVKVLKCGGKDDLASALKTAPKL